MEITEVRVKLVGDRAERVRAFCSVTIDKDFVIRDLKIIEGVNGLFVAMPSRKLADRCAKCGAKNHLRARYCNQCGGRLNENRALRDPQGRTKLHADVAHPINAVCREIMQNAVVEAFNRELERSLQPGYTPTDLDLGEDAGSDYEDFISELRETVPLREDRRGVHDVNLVTPTSRGVVFGQSTPGSVRKCTNQSYDENCILVRGQASGVAKADDGTTSGKFGKETWAGGFAG